MGGDHQDRLGSAQGIAIAAEEPVGGTVLDQQDRRPMPYK